MPPVHPGIAPEALADHRIRLAYKAKSPHSIYKSVGFRPVCLEILASMRGPSSSPSWKANT